jgi:transcriptional regulator with XRE-family HTH domain
LARVLFSGKLLKEVRKARGVTQKALAQKTGLHITTIAYYEIDRREPKATQLKLIADALGVRMEKFFK